MHVDATPEVGRYSDPAAAPPPARERFRRVRHASMALCAMLRPEDTVAQSMPEASPAKWHLAHVTWFFEHFLLVHFDSRYRRYGKRWDFLFNSYYLSVGAMHARAQRGLLTRPTLDEILAYRGHVDAAMEALLTQRADDIEVLHRLELGLNHEQQHQELLLADILHLFSLNPLRPALLDCAPVDGTKAVPLRFIQGREGVLEVGHDDTGFAYDNECPRHLALLHPHALANRCVTNAEFRAFIDDGGYADSRLWLSDGWDRLQREGWRHPLYWSDDAASEFTLSGEHELDPSAPVCHASFFEADAFARWAGARLPTEFEWESAARPLPVQGNLLESGAMRPLAATDAGADAPLLQMFGDVWEWTSSPYVGYPGYRPAAGALGEYNGKFMCGQWVLRGGSCATPAEHVRATYRNFFQPAARWQFSGLRLAKDA